MSYRAIGLSLLLFAADVPADTPAIRYVSPSQFKDVPRVVVNTLLARGCAIPQSGAAAPPENIVSGRFIAKGRRDFAALCSIAGSSRVLVINGSTGSVIAALNPQRDAMHLMDVGGRTLFMRSLSIAAPDGVPFCFEPDEPCPCSGKTLAGIVDEYEKWSETHCWEKGWHTVTSGD